MAGVLWTIIFSDNSMKLSPYAIRKISELVKEINTGQLWVDFFNGFGARDVYDELGLPDIGKPNGLRPSKKEYIAQRLTDINDTQYLQKAIMRIVAQSDALLNSINAIITPENYKIEQLNEELVLMGDVVDNHEDAETEAHFQNIQNQILAILDKARVSIALAMSWFTNDVLAAKIIEKKNEGLDVRVVIFDDGINRRNGVELADVWVKKVKATRGGIMHDKFCVIDNQVVITGSYNWSDNAEFHNDENIVIIADNDRASDFSIEFRRLCNQDG